mgnify:CR=1 FL=1
MPRKKVDAWADITADLDKKILSQERIASGTIRHEGAKKEWNNETCQREMDVHIEDLLRDDYYLGSYNIWPSIIEEIEQIWHMRCDFNVLFQRDTDDGLKTLKSDTVYALTFEQAKRKAIEKWTSYAEDADSIHVYRDHNIHTVCLELPKGTGKDFEMSLIMWLLTREFLILPRSDFFDPYNLDHDTTVAIILMNRSESQARSVTFSEILPKFKSPFFLDYFPAQVDLEEMENARRYPSELRMPRNIVLFPGTGAAASGLGYCVAASCIDEANFMSRSTTGKQSIFGSDEYDAAAEAFNDLHQRMESRFGSIRNGVMTYAGLNVVISSSRTNNDFTQVLGRRSQRDEQVFYKRTAFWNRKPLDLSGDVFQFDVTNMAILEQDKANEKYKNLTAIPEGIDISVT